MALKSKVWQQVVLGKEINYCGVAKENWNFWCPRKESIKTQVPNLVVKRQKIEVPKTGTWHLHLIIGRRRRLLPRLVRKFFAFSPELVLLLRFLVSLSLHSFATPLTSFIFLSCCGSSILSTASTGKCLKKFGFILCTFDSDLVGKVGAGFLACKILFLSVFRCLHTRVVWSLSRSVLRHGWRWQQ